MSLKDAAAAKTSDYLKTDPVLNGQDYAVVSFVNPGDPVVEKNLYYVNKFLVADINKTLTAQCIQMVRKLQVDMRSKITDVLDRLRASANEEDKNLSRILEGRYRDMQLDEDSYIEECRRRYEMDASDISDRYKMYLTENRQSMDTEFDQANDHKTSLRGFKVRGAFARMADARDRAKFLRDNVEPGIHTFVVPMGVWFPVDMEADEVQDQEYMLSQLNELMGKYHEGVHARNQHFAERKREMEQQGTAPAKRVPHEAKDTKARLQEKLRKKKDAQIRADIAALKDAAGASASAPPPPGDES
jgi:hypothetical protein